MNARCLAVLSAATLIALIVLLVFWEMLIAPLRPGGSWLALKVLPLLLAVRGAISGRRYTFQWASMLSLAYLAEGLVRGYSDSLEISRLLAWTEAGLAAIFFALAIASVRASRPLPEANQKPGKP